ncbi:MAG: glycosyltransferase family 1 protein [Bacteroidetes bacterium]|nr:MAG: glycosyltransferase family 1 protein [Bacteroidota bacterium]
MNIAVNARFLLKDRLEGLGRFSHETIQRLIQQHPEHTFHLYFDRPYDQQFIYGDNVVPHVLFPPARHPYLYPIWFDWAVAYRLKKDKADVFYSPDGFLCLRTQVPSLAVIHDLAFEHFPQYVSAAGVKFYKSYFPRYARKAARIATVSEYSKADIVKTYGIAESQIDVVYNGVSETFAPASAEVQQATRAQFSEDKPYFLYVGALQPRKNIVHLLKAFDRLKASGDYPHQLVLVGRDAWQNEEMKSVFEAMQFKSEVRFTGRVSERDLIALLGSATALCYLPYFEGFGLPVAEAMRCGTPVITSPVSSLPEVGGDAALYAEPEDVDAIAQQMQKLASDEVLRASLAQKALVQASQFTWEKTADLVWQSIVSILP